MRYYKYAKAHKQENGNGRPKSNSRDDNRTGNGNADQAEEPSRRCTREARGIEGRQGKSGKAISKKAERYCQESCGKKVAGKKDKLDFLFTRFIVRSFLHIFHHDVYDLPDIIIASFKSDFV